jgi:hypothetical protein
MRKRGPGFICARLVGRLFVQGRLHKVATECNRYRPEAHTTDRNSRVTCPACLRGLAEESVLLLVVDQDDGGW